MVDDFLWGWFPSTIPNQTTSTQIKESSGIIINDKNNFHHCVLRKDDTIVIMFCNICIVVEFYLNALMVP